MWQFCPIPRPVTLSGIYTAFQEHIDCDYVFRGEAHDFYELVLVIEGSIGVTADGDSFILETSNAILHPPMEFHSLRGTGNKPAKILIFSFAADAMPEFTSWRFSLSQDNLSRAKHVLSLFRRSSIAEEKNILEILPDRQREAQRAINELEVLLLTLTEHDSDTGADVSAGARNYRRALDVIEENLALPMDTATLARLSHMSPSLLKKTFSRYAGVGIMEYFRTRKINAAIPLLRAGGSVKEIASQLGFTDAGYFSTVFRRVTGHSPTYYRRG